MTVEESPQPIQIEKTENDTPYRSKRKCIIFLTAASLLFGLIEGIIVETETGYMLVQLCLTLAVAIGTIVWCQIDAQQQNFKISFRLTLLLFLLLCIGLPYYFMKTRKNIQALKAIGIATIFYIILYGINTLAYHLGCYIYNIINA